MEERLGEHGLFSLEKRRLSAVGLRGVLSADLINMYKYLKGECKEDNEDRDRLFPLIPSARAKGHGHKQECRSFCLTIRKHFTVWLTEPWNRLPRQL